MTTSETTVDAVPRKSPVQEFLRNNTHCKIYIRNVPWTSTEDDLKTHFAVAGKVTDVLIPKRRERSLGYAYVAFETSAAADKAITDLNKTKIGDREITVQNAILRTDEELKEIAEKRIAEGKTRRRTRRGGSTNGTTTTTVPANETPASPVKKESSPVKQEEKEDARSSSKRGGRSARGRGGRRPESESTRSVSPAKKESPAKPPVPERPNLDYTRSIYVGNLPWTVKEDELKDIFKEYNPTQVYVPRVRYNADRTKGYGLIEFNSVSQKNDVLQDLEEIAVNGRKLVLESAKAPEPRERN